MRLLTFGVIASLFCGCGCGKNSAQTASSSTTTTPPPAVSMASAPGSEDAIDRLVARLSKNPLWMNGLSAQIDLPETASTKDILAKVFEGVSFDQGKVTRHTILRERKVTIGQEPRPFAAVVVDTNLGRKVVLLQHQGKSGWWSRAFPEE